MTDERYIRNLGAYTAAELEAIRKKSVCVAGCGGLGGFVCAALARFGVGAITVADGDVFAESNLNRQLFANSETLGKSKALTCANELAKINPDVIVTPICEKLTDNNSDAILNGHSLVIDCLDSREDRIMLEKHCAALGLWLVHGAINGLFGHAAVVAPGEGLLARLYSDTPDGVYEAVGKNETDDSVNTDGEILPPAPYGSPVFTAQIISGIQCAEAIKLLAGREPITMRSKLLHINLEENEFVRVAV